MIIIDAMPMHDGNANGKPMNMILNMFMSQCNVYDTGPWGLDVATVPFFILNLELAVLPKNVIILIFIKIKSFKCRI